ncbi:MAG: hypothetical protein WCJ01_07330 [Ignavibacteria bacterium]
MSKYFLLLLVLVSTALFAQNNPHGSSLRFDCSECHVPASWEITDTQMKFSHNLTGFVLTGKHKIADCRGCHKNLLFNNTSTECRDCHSEPHQNTLGKDCTGCHTTSGWKPIDMMQKHNQYRFPLVGVHDIQDCKLCHSNSDNFIYSGTSIDCYSCHKNEYQNTTNPSHALMKLSVNCIDCHTLSSTNWTAGRFVHAVISLNGKHSTLKCSQCHTVQNVTQQCFDCHQNDYNSTANPNHVTGQFLHDCLSCHSSETWTGAKYNHTTTNFPLTGAHTTVACSKCHTSGYKGTSTVCSGCHESNFKATVDPDHVTLGLSLDCLQCHTTTAWKPSGFNHATTGFPLTGAHLTKACSDCHKGTTTGLTGDCYSCHKPDFDKAKDHLTLGYPHTCAQCHSTTSWSGASFNHTATNFPLTGAHTSVACSKCHAGGYKGTSTVCSGCHESNFNTTVDPDHVALGFSLDCLQCHTTAAWKPSSFNHTTTNFPLTGAHTNLTCLKCHAGGYKGTSTVCSGCHQNSYTSAVNPNHSSAGISQDCIKCHTTTAWIPSGFSHATTGFTLTGAHLNKVCSDCHKGTTAGLTGDCYSCHQPDFDKAKDHLTLGYPHTCAQCHSTTDWSGAGFNHTTTNFPLTGAHVSVTCSKCHTSGFSGTTQVCYDCHKTNYTNSTNPNHVKLVLSATCQTCHTTNAGWKPAQFPVHSSYWVIDGAHSAIASDCARCHNGNYSTMPNTCYGCHQTGYDNTANPPHKSLAFPQECLQCHTKTAWKPATFNHDGQYFPIYSGKHKSEWSTCGDCHTVVTNYKVFSCIDCHEHTKASMDSKHRGKTGYSWVSSECYRCHPKGSSGSQSLQIRDMSR